MRFVIFLVVVAAIWLFLAYNKLRALAENVKRAQANIAATVKKRHDIAQRLSDIAAAYGDHEKLTHFTVVEGDTGMAQAAAAAADAARVIGNVQMLANRFPDLKASAAYQQLMTQLENIETTILERREAYNSAAQFYNSTRGSLPHLFYAAQLGFSEAPYFSVDDGGGEQLASFKTDDGQILRAGVQRMAALASTHAQAAASRVKAAGERLQQPGNTQSKDAPAADTHQSGDQGEK
jgi:LemA protein